MAELLKKATKGMFQHKSTDSQNITEVENGVYLNLQAEYQWLAENKLDLDISWDPYVYNENQKKGIKYIQSLSNGFQFASGILTITGGGTQTEKALTNGHYHIQLDNLENVKSVNVSFKYENGNAIVDLTKDFNILKIPKPSKYDDNVVFNRAGLNEMIDYFKKYPVRLTTESSDAYGSISVAHGIDEAKNIAVHGLGHTTNGMVVTTNLIPNTDNAFNLGQEENQWKNLYAKDGIFSNSLKASSLKGLFIGESNPTELSGNSININDNFIVKSDGNVTMKGNITWGNDNAFSIAYHKGEVVNNIRQIPNPPQVLASEINEEDIKNSPRWHKRLNSVEVDWFMSMTFNGGNQWTTPTRINAQDGAEGTVKTRDVLDALKAINEDGIYNFPEIDENGNVHGRLGIKATAIQAALANIGVLEMGIGEITGDANGSYNGIYNAMDNTTLSGGYITFPIPTPFTVTTVPDGVNQSAVNSTRTVQIYKGDGSFREEQFTVPELINQKGWRGRMGYLRGNGNGIVYNGKSRNTAGMGIAVYTNATFADFYNVNKVYLGNIPSKTRADVMEKTHLVLSLLMLTDSGLGLMTAVNQYNPDHWVFLDLLHSGSFELTPADIKKYEEEYNENSKLWPGMILDQGRYPHYQYRWWSGAGEGSKIPRIARLWLHEDNGGLYYSYDYNQNGYVISLTPWNWSGEG